MIANVHSIFTGGTVDGPGIRYVLFLKGCPLRCLYCHNPDTQKFEDGKKMTTEEIVEDCLKYKGYFKTGGGITVSGGEPLCQIDFLIDLFKNLKKYNIHTCVDTSGVVFDRNNKELLEKFDELIKYTDLFLLDIKHIDNEEHIKLTSKPNTNILDFARYLSDNNKKMWIRHVLVPTITLKDEYLIRTKDFVKTLHNVEKIEVLPYHTMGVVKYENLGLDYKLKNINPPTKEEVRHAKYLLGVIKDAA